MMNKKDYILLFQYSSILLFTEVDGKITRIPFSNKKRKLSNCVTFSYERENLEFLPDGDPFEVDRNSSFSDFLDFAGYHFTISQAIEEILEAIIDRGLIPNLNKEDNIFICFEAFYYEFKTGIEGDDEDEDDEAEGERISDVIKGHHIYVYDFWDMINVSSNLIREVINKNVFIGFPFSTIIIGEHEDSFSLTYAPTLEKTVVKAVNEKYPLPTHIPEKLLRNVRNRIIVGKLYNLPLPDTAIYQNRKIDIAKTKFAKRFDEVIKEAANLFKKRQKKMEGDTAHFFDFGMQPLIKETFLNAIKKPIDVSREGNEAFICFMLKNMLVQHMALKDVRFKAKVMMLEKNNRTKPDDIYKTKNRKYYDMLLIGDYYTQTTRKNPLSNLEIKYLKELINK